MNRERHHSRAGTLQSVGLALTLLSGLASVTHAQAQSVRGDFNGDGVADLVIGVHGETIDGVVAAGAVHILYGSTVGLQAVGAGAPPAQLWSQASPGIQDGPESNDEFGTTLAVGDFNGDGLADLAIGAPAEDFGGAQDAGVVHVLYSSAGGLQAIGSGAPAAQLWSQASPGVPSELQSSDGFGSALAVGDFDGDGVADLAIGVHGEDLEGFINAGVVHVLYGSAAGLQAVGSGAPPAQLWSQATPGVQGGLGENRFGFTLAAGDFDGDGVGDLAIGAVPEGIGIVTAGAVHVLYGSPAGLQAVGAGAPAAQLWSQATPGVHDSLESNDGFGATLAVGDFNGDGLADLAIGVPEEDRGGAQDAGVVHVLYGSAAGLQATGTGAPPAQLWSQATPGVHDSPESDGFGAALAAGDFNGDGVADLAIGVHGEDLGGSVNAGVVHVLYGSPVGLQAIGRGAPRAQLWSQASPGVQDGPASNDEFGATLAVGDFNGDGFGDLAIGATGETLSGVIAGGVVHILYGSTVGLQAVGAGAPPPQLWSQATPGVQDVPGQDNHFGSALASY